MLSLVVKGPHAQTAARAAAQQDGEEQGAFRDAPSPPFGLALVEPHEDKSEQVDKQQIIQSQSGQGEGKIGHSAHSFGE